MLIAFDLDGTILKDDKTVSDYTKHIFLNLASKGHLLVPCTGRALYSMPDYFISDELFRYSITSTGAIIYDKKADNYLLNAAFTPEEFLEIIDFLAQFKEVDIDYSINNYMYSDRYSIEHLDEYPIPEATSQYIKSSRIIIEGDIKSDIINNQRYINRANILFKDPNDRKYLLKRRYELPFTFTSSMPHNGEITPLGINKETALLKLADHLDLPYDDVIFFGDSYNDEAALASDKIRGVLMKNCKEDLINVSKRITEYTNEEDGVARYLSDYFKIKE